MNWHYDSKLKKTYYVRINKFLQNSSDFKQRVSFINYESVFQNIVKASMVIKIIVLFSNMTIRWWH